MLESGTERPDGLLVRAFGRNIWRSKREGYFGSDCAEHRASGDPMTKWYFSLSPGGLSNHWTGAVPRFAPEDFTEGGRLHERYEWPVSYEEVTPHYERMERLMGVVASGRDVPCMPGGYAADLRKLPQDWQKVADTIGELGQGLTTLPIADGPRHLLVQRGTAFNSYSNMIVPLLNSPLFSIKQGAHALQLEWIPERRRVGGVIYRDSNDGREHRVEADAFVVAAGPLQTTRLLFDSVSSDFPNGLGNSRDLLGRYLHDHPREWWEMEVSPALSRLSPSIYLTRRPYADSKPLFATSWTLGAASTKEKLMSFTPLKSNRFGVQVFGTVIPKHEYRVTPIAGAQDHMGTSKLDIAISFDAETLDNLRVARTRLLELLDRSGIRANILTPAEDVVPGTAVHYGGTARMHRSPEHGVVDSWNRVFDAPNVLVCDAACFTTGPEKNPTLTAMALAARACDGLAQRLKTAEN